MQPKLLLIDENQVYKDALHVRLEVEGFHVHSPKSVDELRHLQSQKWDVIVSDSQFQGWDSDKLLEFLKPQVNTVFFYTEKSAQELTALWKERGVRDVFSKLRRGELVKAIQALGQGKNHPTSDPAIVPASSRGQSSASGPVLSSSRVTRFLLVDDSPTIRKFVRAILEKGFPGSQIFEAEDGKTALHELAAQKMELIVTDMQMPGVDGQSFIKTLQRNSLLNKKPIVILSGMVTKEMEKEYGAIPTIRILSKPADPGKIIETIKGLLKA